MRLIFFSFLVFQCSYFYSQSNSTKLYSCEIEIIDENPVQGNKRLREIIFTLNGKLSTLNIINYYKNDDQELIETSRETLKLKSRDKKFYVFEYEDKSFIFLVKLKIKSAKLIIKSDKTGFKLKKKKIKLVRVPINQGSR